MFSYFVIQVMLVHIRYELICVCQDILQSGCISAQSRPHCPWGSQQEETQHRLVRLRESRAVQRMAEERLRTQARDASASMGVFRVHRADVHKGKLEGHPGWTWRANTCWRTRCQVDPLFTVIVDTGYG